MLTEGAMHQDTGVLILNFPLGEDRVCWCYLNHCVNLVIDECKVNRSIKLLQSSTERSSYRVTGRAWGGSRFVSFFSPCCLTDTQCGKTTLGICHLIKIEQGFPVLWLFWHSCVILTRFSWQNKMSTNVPSPLVLVNIHWVLGLPTRLAALQCSQWREELTSHKFW